jgi:hypothetical protein
MARDARACTDCSRLLPVEDGDTSTLVSAKYGWRLVREKAADGELVPRWRCPDCWREYKQRSGRP